MTDLKPAVLSLLSALPASVSAAFPGADVPLPSVTVAQESSSVAARADGSPYLEEHTLSVQILAAARETLESLTLSADAALSSLGFSRVSCRDGFDENIRAYSKDLSYRAAVHGDTVYPIH